MTTDRSLGIWMDHSSAHLIELTSAPLATIIVESKFTHNQKEESLSKSEKTMHNKQNHEQGEYYKKLGTAIKNYDDVLLFGPTEAKTELLNVLRADNTFSKIKIEVKQSDWMTVNQEHAFVRDYFSKR
ncbi:MAG TPA: hypothetical protein VK559_06355 [Ferruginibacter sp.]|nr:hypothetical protein [Ferruginibacter sp.]